MKIATWNVNALRARQEFVVGWLEARQPDVVGIQELKLTDEQFPHEAFADAGYHVVMHTQKAWNGVAIFSREPAEVTQRGLPGQEDFGARMISAKVAGLDFTTVYCPNGKSIDHEDFPRKLAWYDALADHFAERHAARESLVLCGDFNIVPASIDGWNEDKLGGSIHHTAEERSRLQRLENWGLVDLYRHLHPDKQAFSWWDYRAGAFHRNMGLRIDFLLCSRDVVDRVRSVEIDRDYRKKKEGRTPSDHAAVIAELD